MLNVEGVVLGNYRCCIEGYDPNKLWSSSIKYKKVKNKLKNKSIESIKQVFNIIKKHG
jgi:hypothetical protein